MPSVTTTFTTIADDRNILLTGQERYPIVGKLVFPAAAYRVWEEEFKGLNQYWDCLPKAQKVQKAFGGIIILGSLFVMSGDYQSRYGYEFNPPYEFHAWVEIESGLLDFALPGVIEKGLTTRDEVGPFIVGRSPMILAGKPPRWLQYRRLLALQQAEADTV